MPDKTPKKKTTQPGPKPRKPIIVDNPNSPQLKAYNDSLNLYNNYDKNRNIILSGNKFNTNPEIKPPYLGQNSTGKVKKPNPNNPITLKRINKDFAFNEISNTGLPEIEASYNKKIKPTATETYTRKESKYKTEAEYDKAFDKIKSFSEGAGQANWIGYDIQRYKKPVQPVVLQKPQQAPVKPPQNKPTQKYIKPQEQKDYPIRGPLPKAQAKINITSPQPSLPPIPQGDYVYGPANSVIGINSKNGFVPWSDEFDPTSNKSQRGKINKADSDLLQNTEELKKYLKTKGLKNGGTIQSGWLQKYPDGGTLKPKLGAKNDPLRPKGLGVQAQDNTRPSPRFSPVEIREIKEAERLKQLGNKQTSISSARQQSIPQQKANQQKKEAYASSQPNAKIVNGQLTEKNPGYKMDGTPFGPNEKRFDKGLDHIVGGLEAASIIMPAGQLVKAGAKAAGKYLTEQTALKNAYKLNPLAFKPNPDMMYRGIGKGGVEDALESGVFRAKQNVEPSLYKGIDMSKQFNSTYYTPKFKTADQYGAGYIAEVPKDVTDFRLRYKGKSNKTWSQIADENIPIEKGRILKKDWLQGYKEVPKPKDINNTYWNGRSYQQGPTSTQEVLSTSSGMDALPKGYNAHLRNQTPYVAQADEAMMPTQGRIDWNGVNSDNVANWFNTRPTKTINGWLNKY